jgi:hypothetical protein
LRPAVPNPGAFAALVRAIEPRLRAETPASFAGLARATDGALEIYVVGANSQPVAAIVSESQASSGSHVRVRVVTGRQHSLGELEALRDQITAAQPRLKGGGVALTEWAVDIQANKVRIGVLNLDPAKCALLGQEFGADRIEVVPGGYYNWR